MKSPPPLLQAKVGSVNVREQQAQQDCFYFLQGRCSKGSLCPFKHDEVGAGGRLQRVLRPGCLHGGPQLWK